MKNLIILIASIVLLGLSQSCKTTMPSYYNQGSSYGRAYEDLTISNCVQEIAK